MCTIHAGEAYGPGIHSRRPFTCAAPTASAMACRLRENGDLLHYVNDHRITLECCPSSNVQTGAIRDMASTPAQALQRTSALRITVNTDNRLITDTTVSKELYQVHSRLGVPWLSIKQIILNGFKSAFLPFHERRAMLRTVAAELEQFERDFHPPHDAPPIPRADARAAPKLAGARLVLVNPRRLRAGDRRGAGPRGDAARGRTTGAGALRGHRRRPRSRGSPADVEYLASDALGGRETGTDGNETAAPLPSSPRLTELGVVPAGTDGYRQPFPRRARRREATADSAVVLRAHEETRSLTPRNRLPRRPQRLRTAATAAPWERSCTRATGSTPAMRIGTTSRTALRCAWAHRRGALGSRRVPPTRRSRATLAGAHIVGSLAGKVRAARERGAAGRDRDRARPERARQHLHAPTWNGHPPSFASPARREPGCSADARPSSSPRPAPVAPAPSRRREPLVWCLPRAPPLDHHQQQSWASSARASAATRERPPPDRPSWWGAHYDHIGRGGWSSLTPGVYAIHNGADDNGSEHQPALLELAATPRARARIA